MTVTPGSGTDRPPPVVVGLGAGVPVVDDGLGLCVLVDVGCGDVVPVADVEVGDDEGAVGEEALVGAVPGVGAVVPGVAEADGPVADGVGTCVIGRALGEVDGRAVRVLWRDTLCRSRGAAEVAACDGPVDCSCNGRWGATYVPTRTAA
ncbi:hypothetical protein FB474_2801 [Oryzihumus leptocrescens]|uniref:Uncharacterized protein n=1 Tax=Oryzihumus leptocrescens TaxID=297536 RepID=A0A542ZM09_9MICO|nr:hypothetical protein FB474_2801 [Oryzihumus leptocrescens]